MWRGAYRDDAVMAICRRKRGTVGQMALAWSPSAGSRLCGVSSSTNSRDLSYGKAARPNGCREKGLRIQVSAYLGLVAQAVGAVDPDVLCKTFASLVKSHVLGELFSVRSVCCQKLGHGYQRMLTLEELDTMVDSPTPACGRGSVRRCSRIGEEAGSP